MTRGRPPYRLLDHTADLGVASSAATLAELFEVTALAMFDQIVDLERVEAPTVEHRLELHATDREQLLIRWLNELLGRAMAAGIVYSAIEVEAINEQQLTARCWGAPLDLRRHHFKSELKAATYHALRLEQVGRSWVAEVIFDV
jgi:SHS2 domain-containing protein